MDDSITMKTAKMNSAFIFEKDANEVVPTEHLVQRLFCDEAKAVQYSSKSTNDLDEQIHRVLLI